MIEDSHQRIAEKILQLRSLKDRRVLEIGCGDGRITSLLAGLPALLVAVEPDKMLVNKARSLISGADFVRGKGEHLALSDCCFDEVLFTLSLHHHRDCQAALEEARRVVKNDGRVLVIEPLPEGEVEQVFMLVHDETGAKLQARAAIEQSGMRVARSEVFSARWAFANSDELCRELFDYYDVPHCPSTAVKIMDLLGPKRDSSPIVLMDSMEILVLAKSA